MEFEKENGMDFIKETEPGRRASRFDFDDFLTEDSLDDRVTAALNGRDLLEPDALGVAADYVPRRPTEDERGRHAAPEEDGPSADFAPDNPRYAAPERPRVVVAEPRRSVYVTPPGGPVDPGRGSSGGGGGGPKWLVAVLAALVVIGVILLISLTRSSRSDPAATASPSPTATPVSTETSAPTQTPAPTEPPKGAYMITVTAGSGGSVSPSGIVSVTEGDDASFTIRANDGYRLSQLLIDGASVQTADSYTFRGVTANHTLYAVFEATATPSPAPTPTPTPAVTPEPLPTPTPEPPAAPDPVDPAPGEGDEIPGGTDLN